MSSLAERLRLISAALAGLLSLACGKENPPSVLIVTVDTLRADHVGAYGSKVTQTPHIDRLAEEGIVFEHAAAPMPLTRPSHFTLLTSRYPREHGVLNNSMSLPESALTLAEILASQGYHTGAFVAVRLLGPDSPLGLRLKSEAYGVTGTVVGVAEDFHNVSLHEEIKPAAFICFSQMSYSLFIKIREGAGMAAVERAAKTMENFNPQFPVISRFLDETISNQYREDIEAFRIFRTAFGLSLLIASLGLLGLVSHSAERRTKEIGIRKVLGASLPAILRILTAEYAILVAAASALAWPVTYYFMSRWLGNFAYRVGFGAGVLLVSTGLAMLTAFLVMSVPAIRAARSNPVDSLRYE